MEEEETVLSLTRPLATSRRTQIYRAPEFEQRLSGSHEVEAGEIIRLEVRIRGIPQPEVRWYKNNRDITDENRYSISGDGFVYKLKLEKVTREDEGTYKVKAKNKEGDSASITYIEVTCKKQRKKFSHARSVSVPAGFPEIRESAQEEDEEREMEDIAPSPLSKRLRSQRGSLRKEHTWPRVISNKSLPSDCITYAEEDGHPAESPTSEEEDSASDNDLLNDYSDRQSNISSDVMKEEDVEKPVVSEEDTLGGDTEEDLFEVEMRHVLECQLRASSTVHQESTRGNSHPELVSSVNDALKAREVWRELTRLNHIETDVSKEQFDPEFGEFSQRNFLRFCDSLFLGVNPESLIRFYALALPAMTCFGLWLELGPVKFCLCVLILCAMRHTGTMYKTFSK